VPARAAVATFSFVAFVLLLSGCGSGRALRQTAPDLSRLTVDLLECTSFTLKKEIEIKRQVIYEPSVMRGWVMMALRYREGGDEKAVDPALPRAYTNVSVVIATTLLERTPLVILRDFSVVEEWKVDTENGIKLCYLWMIDKDHASFRIMAEDFNQQMLAERVIPISEAQATQLKRFHTRLLAMFLERMKNPRSST